LAPALRERIKNLRSFAQCSSFSLHKIFAVIFCDEID